MIRALFLVAAVAGVAACGDKPADAPKPNIEPVVLPPPPATPPPVATTDTATPPPVPVPNPPPPAPATPEKGSGW